ncbi:MAG: putative toxin-antitoxin system toxin component, PIN family [Coleofasciculaceae cyanobacterium SM2_1_6]|nr:putative toxin-antitoxin system toxin component, PIN family [Coleofasciculaceae cyanobacterium SM2_1_6]
MKIVVDTNIFVSSWLWGGIPARLFKFARNHQIIICASEPILAELENTFSKPKLQRKLNSLGFTTDSLMSGTRELVEIYSISPLDLSELRDPKDNIVLATAIAAQTEVIVTGDLDLLILQEYQAIAIVTVRYFLDHYFSES